MVPNVSQDDEGRVEEIRRWFQEHGRKLILKKLDDGWDALYRVYIPNVGTMAPSVFSRTKVEAAENAVAAYPSTEMRGRDPKPTPP